MFKTIKENLALKIVSLLVSIAMWMYVSADRYPNSSSTRTVNAEIVKIGQTPNDIVIRFKTDPLPVEIAGPKSEVDGLADNEIKAEVDVRSLKIGSSQIKISSYKMPKSAPNVEQKGRQFVLVEVLPKVRKSVAVVPLTAPVGASSPRFSVPKLRPEWVTVSGTQDDVRRVARVTVAVESNGGSLSVDLPLRAEDRDGVEVAGIELSPAAVHVDMPLDQSPATKRLVVSPAISGRPASGYVVSDVIVEPTECTVIGSPSAIQNMTGVSTHDVPIDSATGDIVREVAISLPSGVSALNDAVIFRVTVKIKNATTEKKQVPTTYPGNQQP